MTDKETKDEGECLMESIEVSELPKYIAGKAPLRIESGPLSTSWVFPDCKVSVIITKDGHVSAHVLWGEYE